MGNPAISTLATKQNQADGRSLQKSIRCILREAVEIKGITLEVMRELRENWSEESADRARAIGLLTKSFVEAVTIINIERGKPYPGVIRRPTLQPKPRSKPRRLVVLAEPGQADCVNIPPADTTSPTKPLTNNSPDTQLTTA